MVYLVTVSNSVAMLLLAPLNVSVYCRFCFSSVYGPHRLVHRLLVVSYVFEESLVLM